MFLKAYGSANQPAGYVNAHSAACFYAKFIDPSWFIFVTDVVGASGGIRVTTPHPSEAAAWAAFYVTLENHRPGQSVLKERH